jgi:hypothetical protein
MTDNAMIGGGNAVPAMFLSVSPPIERRTNTSRDLKAIPVTVVAEVHLPERQHIAHGIAWEGVTDTTANTTTHGGN